MHLEYDWLRCGLEGGYYFVLILHAAGPENYYAILGYFIWVVDNKY